MDTWDRCDDSKNIFGEKIGEKLAFFVQITASFCKKSITTLVFEKKWQF
jgi:hypothetical protein